MDESIEKDVAAVEGKLDDELKMLGRELLGAGVGLRDLLVVSEDAQRLNFFRMHPVEAVLAMDASKYALKNALSVMVREGASYAVAEVGEDRRLGDDPVYTKITEFLVACDSYATAQIAFGSFWSGNARVTSISVRESRVEFRPEGYDPASQVLDLFTAREVALTPLDIEAPRFFRRPV